MRILINDANILIDLAKLELLPNFGDLAFDLFTTDFVLEELNTAQKNPITVLINNGKLAVIETVEASDFKGITTILEKSRGLSFVDCSAFYYSKKMSGTLLTGDAKLKKEATKEGVEVRGIFFIFDELLKQNLISFNEAVRKMEILVHINNRLPIKEIQKRIEFWEIEKLVD